MQAQATQLAAVTAGLTATGGGGSGGVGRSTTLEDAKPDWLLELERSSPDGQMVDNLADSLAVSAHRQSSCFSCEFCPIGSVSPYSSEIAGVIFKAVQQRQLRPRSARVAGRKPPRPGGTTASANPHAANKWTNDCFQEHGPDHCAVGTTGGPPAPPPELDGEMELGGSIGGGGPAAGGGPLMEQSLSSASKFIFPLQQAAVAAPARRLDSPPEQMAAVDMAVLAASGGRPASRLDNSFAAGGVPDEWLAALGRRSPTEEDRMGGPPRSAPEMMGSLGGSGLAGSLLPSDGSRWVEPGEAGTLQALGMSGTGPLPRLWVVVRTCTSNHSNHSSANAASGLEQPTGRSTRGGEPSCRGWAAAAATSGRWSGGLALPTSRLPGFRWPRMAGAGRPGRVLLAATGVGPKAWRQAERTARWRRAAGAAQNAAAVRVPRARAARLVSMHIPK